MNLMMTERSLAAVAYVLQDTQATDSIFKAAWSCKNSKRLPVIQHMQSIKHMFQICSFGG
jgi:hypothetical protein